MSVNKRKREKVCMKTNDRERLVRKPEKHSCHLVLNVRDLPASLAFNLAFITGSSVGNATWLALLRHFLAFTSIRRAGQRTSGSLSTCAVGILGVESYLQIGTPVAALPGAWCYMVGAGTEWPGISILWLGEVESLICNFCLSMAAHKLVWADPS